MNAEVSGLKGFTFNKTLYSHFPFMPLLIRNAGSVAVVPTTEVKQARHPAYMLLVKPVYKGRGGTPTTGKVTYTYGRNEPLNFLPLLYSQQQLPTTKVENQR